MTLNAATEKKSRFLFATLFLTTVFIATSPAQDPVNVTKFLVLGIFSTGLLGFFDFKSLKKLFLEEKFILVLITIFLIHMTITSAFSKTPFSQDLYGLFGRNTGILTYVFFCILFLVTLSLTTINSIKTIIYALLISGIINILYGLWVHLFGDFIPWKNNYGALLGTFGNPDFAGAFLGITLGVIFALALSMNKIYKLIFFCVVAPLNLLVIMDTRTNQGLIVAAVTLLIVFFNYLRTTLNNLKLHWLLLLCCVPGGFITILGMFQIGPAASLIYKESISLRGIYWDAAFKTGNSHFITGVGMDGFGDWYRRARSEKAATWFPGPDTVTNVAHNIYLDLYANGGVTLFFIYFTINVIAVWRLFKVFSKRNDYDWIATALAAGYLGYQSQALISISQIGIGIWGWVLPGAILSYERLLKSNTVFRDSVPKYINAKKTKYDNSKLTAKQIILVPSAMLVGMLVSLPPFIADAKWTTGLKNQNLSQMESALSGGYFTPLNSDRLANAVLILSNSNLDDLAYKYALRGVTYNPDFFDSWKMLYYARKASYDDKRKAISNMKRLDPNNKLLERF